MAKLSSDHRHAREALFKRFGDNLNGEAFDYYSDESGILVEYLQAEKEYLGFQDLGVRGSTTDEKAPDSPFRFKGSFVNKDRIYDWVKKEGFLFRSRRGRIMSRESTAWAIASSIAITGLYPKNYWKNMDADIQKLTNDIIEMDTRFLNLGLDTIIEIYES